MNFDNWADGENGMAQQDGVQQEEAGAAKEQPKPKPRRAPAKQRPKLTLAHLEKPNGLLEVFDKFPKWFADGYKGKGHEVRDLRRLLELYQRWHLRVFPHGTYNQFELALEKMSGMSSMKNVLNQMRSGLIDLVDPPSAPEEQPEDAHDQLDQQHDQQQQPGGQEDAGTGYGSFEDIDDDELLAMQAEAAMEVAEEAVPEAFEAFDENDPAPAAKSTAIASDTAAANSAVVLGLSDPGRALGTRGASNVPRSKRTMREWSDDDDDDNDEQEDADIGSSRQQKQQQQQPTNGTAIAVGGRAGHYFQQQHSRIEPAAVNNVDSEPGEGGDRLQHNRAARGRLQRQHISYARAAAVDYSPDPSNSPTKELTDLQDYASPQQGAASQRQQHSQQQQHLQEQWQQHQQQAVPEQRHRQLLMDDYSDSDEDNGSVGAGVADRQLASQAVTGTQGTPDLVAPLLAESLPGLELLMGTEMDESDDD